MNRARLFSDLDRRFSDREKAFLLEQAIDLRMCVRWTLNRAMMHVEPRLLYRLNGILHCEAIVLQREGIVASYRRLDRFRVSSIGAIAPLQFDLALERDVGPTIAITVGS